MPKNAFKLVIIMEPKLKSPKNFAIKGLTKTTAFKT